MADGGGECEDISALILKLSKMSVLDLKKECARLSVDTTGKKEEMVERLKCVIKKKDGEMNGNGVSCQCMELKKELEYLKVIVAEKTALLEERRLRLLNLEEINTLLRDKVVTKLDTEVTNDNVGNTWAEVARARPRPRNVESEAMALNPAVDSAQLNGSLATVKPSMTMAAQAQHKLQHQQEWKKLRIISVKPKVTGKNSKETKTLLKRNINISEIKTGLEIISSATEGGINVRCDDSGELEYIKKAVEKAVGEEFVVNIELPLLKHGRVKIFGVDPEFIVNDEVLYDSMVSKNNLRGSDDGSVPFIKIVYKSKQRADELFDIVVEVDEITKSAISGKKVYIGWNRCYAREHIYVKQCNNCLSYGHYAAVCNNNAVCAKCAGQHSRAECNAVVESCNNCAKYNNWYNLELDIGHSASSPNCPCLARIKKRESM
jgi:SAP domain